MTIAGAALGLFIYAYLSASIDANGILSLLVKGQFSGALAKSGVAGITVLVILLALTLLFGRLYCSVLCPLGTLQELFWRAGRFWRGNWRFRQRRNSSRSKGLFRKGYQSAPGIRYIIPLLVGVGAALSFYPLKMLDPISAFGRGLVLLRGFLVNGGGLSIFALITAVPLLAILALAFFRGRLFCDWCPVGSTLGLFASVAPFGMNIASRCVSCGICEKECPAACLDSKTKRIDSGRCVLCFTCASVCPTSSTDYGFRGKPAVSCESRRIFLKGAGRISLLCGAAYLLGPSSKVFSRPAFGNATPQILPPGAKNQGHYQSRCIGCLACVASCPVGILKVQNHALPVLAYSRSSCHFNCVECGRVCPTGAIYPLDVEEKHRTRIALSALYFERCVVNRKRQSCGACAEVCPTGAIIMIPYEESGVSYLTKPVYDEQYCIGCGACYAACPAEPRAFVIEGVREQTLTIGARPPEESGGELIIQNTEDFPF
jgi:ferredoxin